MYLAAYGPTPTLELLHGYLYNSPDMLLKRLMKNKIVFLGGLAGAIGMLIISLLMDALYADALQGTWRDAISKDLGSLCGTPPSPDGLLVYAVFGLVLLVLMFIGAFMGIICAFYVQRLFGILGGGGRE